MHVYQWQNEGLLSKDPETALRLAILDRAVKDYLYAYYIYYTEERETAKEVCDLLESFFFYGDWFRTLFPALNGHSLVKEMRRKVRKDCEENWNAT